MLKFWLVGTKLRHCQCWGVRCWVAIGCGRRYEGQCIKWNWCPRLTFRITPATRRHSRLWNLRLASSHKKRWTFCGAPAGHRHAADGHSFQPTAVGRTHADADSPPPVRRRTWCIAVWIDCAASRVATSTWPLSDRPIESGDTRRTTRPSVVPLATATKSAVSWSSHRTAAASPVWIRQMGRVWVHAPCPIRNTAHMTTKTCVTCRTCSSRRTGRKRLLRWAATPKVSRVCFTAHQVSDCSVEAKASSSTMEPKPVALVTNFSLTNPLTFFLT